MSDLIVGRAAAPIRGAPQLGGDKSISHRALMLAAVSDGDTRLVNVSGGADVAATMGCLRALGIEVTVGEANGDGTASSTNVHLVRGRGLDGLAGPAVTLDCADSGTTMRLLAGLLASQDREYALVAGPSLSRRPMARVIEPLREMGAAIGALGPDGRPPIHGQGGRLHGVRVELSQASAQVGSAVLLAGLRAAGRTTVIYPAPVRDHTERMLAAMGAPIRWDGHVTELEGPVSRLYRLGDGEVAIPNDPSSAAFMATAAAIIPGSEVRLPSVCLNPGRHGYFDALRRMGAPVDEQHLRSVCGEPVADLVIRFGPLRAIQIGPSEVPAMIDELPLIAVLATQAEGRTVVRGAAELRVKETDRIAVMADALGRLGADIESLADGFMVTGPTPLRAADLDGCGDHRMVMALAVAGLAASGMSRVRGAERMADSYPDFAADLAACGANLVVRP